MRTRHPLPSKTHKNRNLGAPWIHGLWANERSLSWRVLVCSYSWRSSYPPTGPAWSISSQTNASVQRSSRLPCLTVNRHSWMITGICLTRYTVASWFLSSWARDMLCAEIITPSAKSLVFVFVYLIPKALSKQILVYRWMITQQYTLSKKIK